MTSGESILVDTIPPVLSGIEIRSNNSDNTSLAKAQDMLFLEFDSSEKIKINELIIDNKDVLLVNDT